MDIKLIILLVFVGLVHVNCGGHKAKMEASSNHHNWGYAANGPSTWGGACDGKKQSPINIINYRTSKYKFDNRVFSHNYWREFKGKYTMINNGHALQINLPANNKYFLLKGNKKYTPLQIHLHFDPITGRGSEHSLNWKKYFAEIHIVHKKTSYKGKEFMNHPDGLLVIAIFVNLIDDFKKNQASDLDFHFGAAKKKLQVPNERTSFAMQLFSKGARRLIKPGSKKVINPFPLAWILPKVPRHNSFLGYVNYKGSLTTPPCSEIVDWIVITGKTLEINKSAANIFKRVKNSHNGFMAGNNRPIRDWNGRVIYGVKGSI